MQQTETLAETAAAIAQAVRTGDASLILRGLSGSCLIEAGRAANWFHVKQPAR